MNSTRINYLIRNIFKILFIALIGFQALRIFMPFVLVTVVAILMTLAVEPYVVRVERKTQMSRGKVTILMTTFFVLIILLPILFFGLKGSNLILHNLIPYLGNAEGGKADFVAPFQELTQKIGDTFDLDTEFINEKLGLAAGSLVGFVASLFRNIISEVPDTVFSILLFILTLGVLMMNFSRCKSFVHRYSNMNEERYNRLVESIARSARIIFVSNIVTGVVQASIVALGALFCGFSEIFLIFFITMICSFVPLIGAAPIALVLAGISFYTGSAGAGIAMLIVAGIAGVSDNIIRSFGMTSADDSMHPFIAFLAVIGGIIVYGIPGLLLGPLIASICYDCLPIIVEDLIQDGKDESR